MIKRVKKFINDRKKITAFYIIFLVITLLGVRAVTFYRYYGGISRIALYNYLGINEKAPVRYDIVNYASKNSSVLHKISMIFIDFAHPSSTNYLIKIILYEKIDSKKLIKFGQFLTKKYYNTNTIIIFFYNDIIIYEMNIMKASVAEQIMRTKTGSRSKRG